MDMVYRKKERAGIAAGIAAVIIAVGVHSRSPLLNPIQRQADTYDDKKNIASSVNPSPKY